MIINQLIETLSDQAIVSTLTPSSIIVYDKNELKVYVGFTNNRESVEYTKEVILLLSTVIPTKTEIREIIVSKNGDYVILEGPRSIFVVRIGTEILFTKPDRLPSECFCECYSLHDSLLLQNSALSIVKVRVLAEKCDEKTIIAAVLFSDNCIRFYNLQKKFDSLLLGVDFRDYLHQGGDENIANNTFGLQKALGLNRTMPRFDNQIISVSFDMIPPQPKSSHFSLIAVDSDAEFYGSFIHFSCFKEGVSPRIHRLEIIDGIPCDPIDLQYITTSNPRITSIFILVSGGGILSHLVVFPNEFGEFQLLVNDQLRLPLSFGDPKIVRNQIKKLNVNRYEIATSSCLYSVNISPWFDSLTSGSAAPRTNQESRVFELVNALVSQDELPETKKWTGARALRAIAVKLSASLETDETEDDTSADSEDVMHLVIIENKNGQPAHVFNIATFDSNTWNIKTTPDVEKHLNSGTTSNQVHTLEQQLADLKPLAACVISDKVSCEDAIDAALKFFEAVDERLKKHSELAQAFVDRTLALTTTAHNLAEKMEKIDTLLGDESEVIEVLKTRLYATKERMEESRKDINVLFHRVEENAPLSDNEIRIFEKLKERQKMLSELSIYVPKMTLDTNELNRMTEVLLKKRSSEEDTNKFVAVERNAAEIDNLESREKTLQEEIAQLTV